VTGRGHARQRSEATLARHLDARERGQRLGVIGVVVGERDAAEAAAGLGLGAECRDVRVEQRARVDDEARIAPDDVAVRAGQRERARVVGPDVRDVEAVEQAADRTLASMFFETIARGRWTAEEIELRWRDEAFDPSPTLAAAADRELEALAARGSPSHDSTAARMRGVQATDRALHLELEPIRWSLRLVERGASDSLATICLVRDPDGRWLAGRRAPWVGIWPGRWHLGAAGGVAHGEDPVVTLERELHEEWQLRAAALAVRGLVRLPNGMVWLVGEATVDGEPVPNAEHDAWAWWPADPAGWPDEAEPDSYELAELFG
jgi:hypothetical protein